MAVRTKAVLGDVRRDARADWLLERIVSAGSLVLREIGGTREGEVAVGRFLMSEKVDVAGLLAPHVARTAAAAAGRRIVAAQDTTEINFAGRAARRRGLGPAGNGADQGFFIHPVIAVDADSEAVLGVAGAKIWTRADAPTPPHAGRAYEDKESLRWLEGAQSASKILAPSAARVIMVADREGDIYPLFARKPADIDVIVRGNHDRALADGSTLFAAPAGWLELGRMAVRVAPRGPGDKGRVATVALKAGLVTIKKPKSSGHKQDPAALTLGLVEAREIDAGPAVTKPLVWRLVTTLPVATLAEAEDAVRLYRLRWRIEEVFRTLKSDGLKLEDTQVESAGRLFKLAALGVVASTRIIQLVDARDGSHRPATDIIEASQMAAAAAIGAKLEGRTGRQKNHHAKGSLAWLAWIVARLGGWNCYYKPPGPKTMARGLDRLLDRIEGFAIATGTADV
jgi:Transposase DDE domain